MTDLRHQAVMIFGGNHVRNCPDRFHDASKLLDRAVRRPPDRTEKERSSATQVDVCRLRTGMLLSCHGVSANKWSSQAFRLAAYCKRRAADVNDQGLL